MALFVVTEALLIHQLPIPVIVEPVPIPPLFTMFCTAREETFRNLLLTSLHVFSYEVWSVMDGWKETLSATAVPCSQLLKESFGRALLEGISKLCGSPCNTQSCGCLSQSSTHTQCFSRLLQVGDDSTNHLPLLLCVLSGGALR